MFQISNAISILIIQFVELRYR